MGFSSKPQESASSETANSSDCDLCGANDFELLLEKHGAAYRRCRECRFIVTSLGKTESDEANDSYFAETIDKYVKKSFALKKQKRYAKKLRQFRPYRKLNRLLEIGANVGGFVYQAREQGWDSVGIEPVVACAEFAKSQHGLKVISEYLENAGLDAESFDAIYSNAVFEHLPAPSAAFAEVRRLLRPGGVVYIDTVNYESYTRENIGAEWKLIDPTHHLCLYSPKTMRRHCEKAGLIVLEMTTHGVRFRPNHLPRLEGLARWAEELKKLPWSIACRFSLKGDSISVLAQRPLHDASEAPVE
ncbi:MAG: class I SAM-dependent methyltransferase [Planctomycetota bacterium]